MAHEQRDSVSSDLEILNNDGLDSGDEEAMLQRALALSLQQNAQAGTTSQSTPSDTVNRKRTRKDYEEQNDDDLESESPPNKKQKLSNFDDFFAERKRKFTAKKAKAFNNSNNTKNSEQCHNITLITECDDDRTFEDLLLDGTPNKSTKPIISEQVWICSACTLKNTDMNAIQCSLCETPRKFVSEEKEQKIDCNEEKELTFITYNVWFNEELKVKERMNAIGNIIKSHDADIVCLQEVTPLILSLLQSGHWYKSGGYTLCSLPLAIRQLPYFNVILTKHEFVKGSGKLIPFSNSRMGRFLVMTPIQLKNNKKRIVYAATTHLESPVGAYAGGKKDKFSAERIEQFQFSLASLDEFCKNSNVIFGGDMNWCRPTKNYENDGDMNKFLGKEWIDCYQHLHPNENGYTYDGKQNGMLSNYLQNRLDRVLYKNTGELKLIECDMIGKDAIPSVEYTKVVRKKQKTLPVLPSDHYGLMAKFDFV